MLRIDMSPHRSFSCRASSLAFAVEYRGQAVKMTFHLSKDLPPYRSVCAGLPACACAQSRFTPHRFDEPAIAIPLEGTADEGLTLHGRRAEDDHLHLTVDVTFGCSRQRR